MITIDKNDYDGTRKRILKEVKRVQSLLRKGSLKRDKIISCKCKVCGKELVVNLDPITHELIENHANSYAILSELLPYCTNEEISDLVSIYTSQTCLNCS